MLMALGLSEMGWVARRYVNYPTTSLGTMNGTWSMMQELKP